MKSLKNNDQPNIIYEKVKKNLMAVSSIGTGAIKKKVTDV